MEGQGGSRARGAGATSFEMVALVVAPSLPTALRRTGAHAVRRVGPRSARETLISNLPFNARADRHGI